MKSFLASAVLLLGSFAAPAQAVQYDKAKITKIVDGDAVFIDQLKATVGETAPSGATLRTAESRASLLFDPTAIGLMGRNTVIQLGSQCFRGEQGSILVNGKLIACLGTDSIGRTKLAGSRGTTYVLQANDDASTSIYVLAGEVVVGDTIDASALGDEDYQILSRYPSLSPTLGVGANFFALEEPRRYPDGFGSLSAFVPFSQSSGSELTYGSISSSTDFERYFGVDLEVGRRWFNALSQSVTGVYLGYSNVQSSVCSNSVVKTGVQYERSRFRYGVTGGFKADACALGFSYGQFDLGIPLVELSSSRIARLTLSPYLLWGNDMISLEGSTSSSDFGSSIDLAPGGRLTLDVPVTDTLKLTGYGSYDEIFGFAGGGKLSYRLPIGGSLVRDPNAVEPSEVAVSTPPSVDLVLRQGQKASFSPQGDLIGAVEEISSQQVKALMLDHLEDQDRIPESRQLADLAASRQVLTPQLSAILGIDFDVSAGQPVSHTLNDPYSSDYPTSLKFQPKGLSWNTWRRRSLRAD